MKQLIYLKERELDNSSTLITHKADTLITWSSTRCSLCGRMNLYLNEEEFK